jgi:hypothetical protein
VQWTSPRFRAVALSAVAACGGASKPFEWRAVAPCPVARFEAMAGVSGGKMMVMGGFTDAALSVTSRIDVYDPATDTWTVAQPLPSAQTHVALTDLPEPRKGAAAAAIGNSIIVSTGSPTSVDPSDKTWIGCCLP